MLTKSTNLAGRPILTTFSLPQNHQNLQQQKIQALLKQTFSCERCRKNHFLHSHAAWRSLFFLIRTQRGSTIFTFCDTSHTRSSFFSFFQHLPSGKLKNHQNRILDPWLGRLAVEDGQNERQANRRPARADTNGTRFQNWYEFSVPAQKYAYSH